MTSTAIIASTTCTWCNFFKFTDGSSWRAYVARSLDNRVLDVTAEDWLEAQRCRGNIREIGSVILIRMRAIREQFDPRPASQTASRVAFELIARWIDARVPDEVERLELRANGYVPDISRTAQCISKKWRVTRPRSTACMVARDLTREFAVMV